MTSTRKTVFVGFKFSHMGPHAGYDLVRHFAHYDILGDFQRSFSWWERILRGRSMLSRAYLKLVGSRLWWVEIWCLLLALRHRRLTFHFAYAENTYRHLAWFKWLGFRIACTYHQPPGFYLENPKSLRGLKSVDRVIVLSEAARHFFSELVPSSRVHYIPHGVDTGYFSPNGRRRSKELLMVGGWLRDFQFADRVFRQVVSRMPDVRIAVVTARANHVHFSAMPELQLYAGISDADLLELYRRVSVLFLPLHGFVANNAVLEMLAVGGRVVIAADASGDEDLAPHVEYMPRDLEAVVEALISRLSQAPEPSASRDFVEMKFSWQSVGAATSAVLRAL